MPATRDDILIAINGTLHRVAGAEAFLSLSDYLRETRRWTGTKIVCSEGDCGACSVLVGRPARDQFDYQVIDACIGFMYQLDGHHVVTVEGISSNGTLSPVQQAMIDQFGSQCGFCTPGFVVAMTGLLENTSCHGGPAHVKTRAQSEPSGGELDDVQHNEDFWRQGLSGNLCRCTGYLQIEEAARTVDTQTAVRLNELYPPAALLHSLTQNATQDVEIIFQQQGRERRLAMPTTFAKAVELKGRNPAAMVVNGATDVGVTYNKRKVNPDVVISLSRVTDADVLQATDTSVVIGARTNWTQLEKWSASQWPELHAMIIRFGSPQIRNMATVVGNVANASPIGDMLPLLHVMDAELELVSRQQTRTVNVNEFYLGYKQLDLQPDELIRRVTLPRPRADEQVRLYKVSKRHDLDISTFTAAIRMTVHDETIRSAKVAYGGVGPVVLRLAGTESFLEGELFTEATFRAAGRQARQEITPISDVRGSAEYRCLLAENILLKFYHQSAQLV